MLGASANNTYRRTMMFASDPGTVIAQVVFSMVDAFALTVLVFLRKGFGERFLTPFKYLCGIAILTFLMALRAIASTLLGGLAMLMGGPLMGMMAGSMLQSQAAGRAAHPGLFDAATLLYWAFILVGGVQLGAVLVRSYLGGDSVPIHSKSTGEPMLSFGGKVSHFLTTIVLEPSAVLFMGYVLTLCDHDMPLSYFIVLALFLQASAVHQWRLARDEMLDEQDSKILAGFYAAQVKHVTAGGKATPRLGGYFVPFVLPKKPGMQLDVLRRWAQQHHEAAADVPAPAALQALTEPSSSSGEARQDEPGGSSPAGV